MPSSHLEGPPVTTVGVWQRADGWLLEMEGLGAANCQTLAEVAASAELLLRNAYGDVPDGVEYLVVGFGNDLCPDARGRLVAVDSSGHGDEEELVVAVSHDDGLDQAHISLMINDSGGPDREGYISLQLDQIDFLQQALAEARVGSVCGAAFATQCGKGRTRSKRPSSPSSNCWALQPPTDRINVGARGTCICLALRRVRRRG
jgi:hypothetical protein